VPRSGVALGWEHEYQADTDDAIFAAYKVAKAAGDVARARALLDLLVPKMAAADAASTTSLSLVRGKGGRR
jgi:hypothetical protein